MLSSRKAKSFDFLQFQKRGFFSVFRVAASDSFSKELECLKEKAEKNDSFSIILLKLVNAGIEKLKYDFHYGDHIPKSQIPKEYFEKFGVENLWKLNLGSFWRLIYTVRGTEVEVVSIVLEVLDHKDYDRKFGYKTS